MGAILKRIAQKLGISKDTLKSILYMVLMAALYAVVGLVSFTETGFSMEIRADASYWINIGLALASSLLMFYLAWQMSKSKNLQDESIIDEEEIIRSYGHTIQINGEYTAFKEFLKEKNKERRLDAYRDYLLRKIERTKNETKRDDFEKKYQAIKDNLNVRIPYFIQIEEYTYGNIIIGFQHNKKDDGVKFRGVEGLIATIAPSFIFTIAGVALAFGITLNFKESPLDQIKNFITLLFTITTYLVRGLNFGDRLIMVVYKSRLENRQNVIKEYFQSSKRDIHAFVNDNYKYLAEITNKEVENNGI